MDPRNLLILDDTLTIVLAGGQGERLQPLTRDRSKPAVPFAGMYRIIDFTLSNCLNSGLRKIYVLTQYKSASLQRHIQLGWGHIFSPELGHWIQSVPPQLRVGQRWYEGTADAVYHNLYLIEQESPRLVLVLSGDHIYKMNYRKMMEAHDGAGALVTIGAVEVPLAEASAFGVLEVDESSRITGFAEKPAQPKAIPGKPERALVNMGVYCFDTQVLLDCLRSDAEQPTRHDFGHDILPSLVGTGRLLAYPFVDENRKGSLYWRDIGTVDSFYDANMDLVQVDPHFNLYDENWPLRTHFWQLPPAKTVFAQEERPDGRLGIALDSIMCPGAIISGGRVERSIVGPGVRVNSWAEIVDSVLLGKTDVGRRTRLRRVIVDKYVRLPPGFEVGFDHERDRERFHVSEGGIVVIPRGTVIDG